MSDLFGKFVPSLDAIVAFHRANFDAMVQAQQVLINGLQEISKEFVAQTQTQIEAAAVAGKSALSAKSVAEVVELNVDGAKGSYEKFVAASSKLSQLSAQVTNDTFAPLKARATAATETFLKPLAA
jgi:phasin family protein